MSIVVLVFGQGETVIREGGAHKLTDQTAEIGRHEHGFEPAKTFGIQLLIDETEKVRKFAHRGIDMIRR